MLRDTFGAGAATEKLEFLRLLERTTLSRAKEVRILHDVLCYWRAYPENREILDSVERMLERFDRRRDLRRFWRELQDSGIAGTALHFPFFWLMAVRVAERWPDSITIAWKDFENASDLKEILELLVPFSETPGLDSMQFSAKEWIHLLKGSRETDAAFIIRRFDALRGPAREYLYERLDMPIRLAPGPDTPARTREKWDEAPVVFQRRPPSRSRPSIRYIVRSADFRVRSLALREARKMIDLANATMIPRHRDLLVFLHGDENDVRIIDFGDGLQFACIGAKPEGRLILEAVYGFLTLRNGVPIGYLLNSALFNSCELAYNVFENFRGAETAEIYGRFVATVHRLFGADSFTVDPYQLGHENREGLLSGAWWFYYKLGFRSRDPEIRALVREELAKMKRNRSHRTSLPRLRQLVADNLFFSLRSPRADVLGRISLGNIGVQISRYLAERFGSERERGIRVCSEEAAQLLRLRNLRRLPRGERIAWERWSPLVLALPGVERWSPAEKNALAAVVRAKGGKRESDFVRLFDGHAKLRRAVLELAREE